MCYSQGALQAGPWKMHIHDSSPACKGLSAPSTNTSGTGPLLDSPELRTHGNAETWHADWQGSGSLNQIMEMIIRRASLYSPFPICCLEHLQQMLKATYFLSPKLYTEEGVLESSLWVLVSRLSIKCSSANSRYIAVAGISCVFWAAKIFSVLDGNKSPLI